MNSTQGPTSVLQADYAVEIDLTLYGLDVIFRTAYAYTDRCFLWLEHASDGQIRVSFKAKEKSDGIEGIAGRIFEFVDRFRGSSRSHQRDRPGPRSTGFGCSWRSTERGAAMTPERFVSPTLPSDIYCRDGLADLRASLPKELRNRFIVEELPEGLGNWL